MAFGVTITIGKRADETCGLEPESPIHVPLGATILFENSTDKTVTLTFTPPLPPGSIEIESKKMSPAFSPSVGSYDMTITCWPPTEAGPKLIIDNP
jgi:hypothetical protein